MQKKTRTILTATSIALLALAGVGIAMAHEGGMRGGLDARASAQSLPENFTLVDDFDLVVLDERTDVFHASSGSLRARSLNGTSATLTLPAGASVAVHDAVEDWSPAGATVTYADGTKANLVLRNATLSVDGQIVTVALAAEGALDYHVIGDHAGGCPGFGHGGMEARMGRGPHGGARGFDGPR